MIPVLAKNNQHFKQFIRNNGLSENKYFFCRDQMQLRGIERGSIVLLYETWKQNPYWQELITIARHRNCDCIRVK